MTGKTSDAKSQKNRQRSAARFAKIKAAGGRVLGGIVLSAPESDRLRAKSGGNDAAWVRAKIAE